MNTKIGSMVESIYGLTPLQEGMLYHNMLEPNSSSYILQNVLRLTGKYSNESMKLGLKLLAMKYEVLRTLILYRSVENPLQVLLKEREIEYNVTDYSMHSKEQAEILCKEAIHQDVKRGFELEKDTLFRLNVLQVNHQEILLLLTAHHIIIDGWSMSFLVHDLLHYYEMVEKKTDIKDLEQEILRERQKLAPYREYVKLIESMDTEEGLNYWEELLNGYNQIAVIEPLEASTKAKEDVRIVDATIDMQTTLRLKDFAKEKQVTISVIYETAWAILLQKYNRTQDVVFGKVVSGRQKGVKGMDQAVGLFINTIPVRVLSEPNVKIIDLLKQILSQEIDSFQYDYCPLADIQQRSELKGTLFETIFVFENYYQEYNYEEGASLHNLDIQLESGREQTNYPISVAAFETDQGMTLGIMYDTSIYAEETVKRICGHMKVILNCILDNPEGTVNEIELVTDEEREQILHEFNDSYMEFDRDKTFVDLFEEQVEAVPDNTALKHMDRTLTYKELNGRANVIANLLIEYGIGRDDFVAILARTGIELIVGIIGIIKAGGCYVPLDINEPKDRMELKLKDCMPKAILVYQAFIETSIPVIDLEKITFSQNEENPKVAILPENLMYMIYTSGTTGRPKGVMIEHRNIVNFKECCREDYGGHEKKSVLLLASITFDASVAQYMMALLFGAPLYIPDSSMSGDTDYLRSFINREGITLVSFPPQLAGQMDEITSEQVITAGSEATREVAQKIIGYADYVNAYGPTEATICATFWRYDKNIALPNKIPIGKPHKNYKVYILNENKICGIGIAGELCILGEGIARGYHNQPDMTAKVFVDNPFGEGKMYRSGDLACWHSDGNIEFLGRIDDQVKVRGYRIELLEIEETLRTHMEINDCTVITIKNTHEENCIAAYIVSSNKLSGLEVRDFLRKSLPEYMIPEYIMQIEEVPVNASGKVDKNKLPKLDIRSERNYVKPSNPLEEKICEIFRKILGADRVGVEDRFMELGGNSINAMRLVSSLAKENLSIYLGDMMYKQTPRAIAEHISGGLTESERKTEAVSDKILPLTRVQHSMMGTEDTFHTMVLQLSNPININAEKIAFFHFVKMHPIMNYKLDKMRRRLYLDEGNGEYEIKTHSLSDKALMRKFIKEQLSGAGIYSVFNITVKGEEFIVVSFHTAIMDRQSLNIFLDQFSESYYESVNYGSSDAKEAETEYISWLEKRADEDMKEMAVNHLRQVKELELSSELSYALLNSGESNEFGVFRNRMLQIISNVCEELEFNKGDSINYLEQARLGTKDMIGSHAVGPYYHLYSITSEGDILDGRKENSNLVVTIIPENDLFYKAENASIRMELYEIDEVNSFSDHYLEVIIRDGCIKFRMYSNDESRQMPGFLEILKKWIEDGYSMTLSEDVVNQKRERIADQVIEDAFNCNDQFNRYDNLITYTPLARQKLFLYSSFAGICVGKVVISGIYKEEELVAVMNHMIHEQSALRSCFADGKNLIAEKKTDGQVKIPYFNLTSYSFEESHDFINRLERYGNFMSRYTDNSLLVNQCIIKLAESVHIIYLFAHHVVCDMVSLHIWKQILESNIAAIKRKPEPVQIRNYSDFVISMNAKNSSRMESESTLVKDREHRQKFVDEIGGIDISYEVGAVTRNVMTKERIESNAAYFSVDFIYSLISVCYSYAGTLPYLFVHHGRNQENGMTIGLYISLFQLELEQGDKSSLEKAANIMSDMDKLAEYKNLLDASAADFENAMDYPMININVVELEYNQTVLNEKIVDNTDFSRAVQFRGISLQLVFFTDAVRLIVRCDKKYQNEVKQLCLEKMDDSIVIDEILI